MNLNTLRTLLSEFSVAPVGDGLYTARYEGDSTTNQEAVAQRIEKRVPGAVILDVQTFRGKRSQHNTIVSFGIE